MKLDRVIAVRNNKTVYRDGDCCIKVFDKDFTKADILKEALIQARMEETSLNVPAVREVRRLGSKWAIFTDYVRGKTLERLISEQPVRKKDCIDLLIRVQREVHSLTCPGIEPLKEKLHRRILRAAVLDAETKETLLAKLTALPDDHKICHGDLGPANIIVSEYGKPYLLDWPHAALGCPAADAARSYLVFWLSGDIDGAEYYLERYSAASGIPATGIRDWMPVVAASQCARGNEKEREFLLYWIKNP
ncbi:MAG: phosphotransferase [Clostridia bacterium]|nr:phosphotransferase [Clostridia bacterium]